MMPVTPSIEKKELTWFDYVRSTIADRIPGIISERIADGKRRKKRF